MYHVFFLSSVDGYLGCFYILGIVSNAPMSIGVRVSFLIIVLGFFLDIYPGVEFLVHTVFLSTLVF